MPINRRRAWLLLILALIPPGYLTVLSWLSRPPDNLGVRDGRLAPCPASPNCVSTDAPRPEQRLDPIPFDGTAEDAATRLRQALAQLPRTRIATDDGLYLHAECSTAIFRFVDDVEFLIDPAARVVHFRSASRVGYWDLGANRRRMEQFRRLWDETPSQLAP